MNELNTGRRFPTASPDGEIARVLLAFLATAGIFYVNIMPAIVDGLIEGLSFSNREAGLVASANTYGAAFGAFLVVFFVKRLDWRKTSYALLFALLAMDLGSIVIREPGTMIAARAVHGFVGGALVGIGFSVMSRTSEVSRTFGYLLSIQFGLGGLGIIYLPPLAPIFGTKALFLSLAAFSFVTLLMVPFLDTYPPGANHHGRSAGKIRYLPAAAAPGSQYGYLCLLDWHRQICRTDPVICQRFARGRGVGRNRRVRTGDFDIDKIWSLVACGGGNSDYGRCDLGFA